MAKLIAYSNNAPSDKVTDMLEAGHFERIFHHFDTAMVANEKPEQIILNQWHNIKEIRFKKKVNAIVRCANLLLINHKYDSSIESIYKNTKIPINITSDRDIEIFWDQFYKVLADYQKLDMPYFKNMTTLLHLLLHLGFPCVKPDLIVMKVAASIGLVEKRSNHNTYNIKERILVVKTIQQYCMSRNLKPAVLDFYILIYGGQKDALKYVRHGFTVLSN